MAHGEHRRFQNTREGHFKAWECRQDGRVLHISYGRIGISNPQRMEKDHVTEHRATQEMARLVRDKLGKGYVEVNAGGVPIVEVPSVNLSGTRWTLERPANVAAALSAAITGCQHSWDRINFTDKRCLDCGINVRAEDACTHPRYYTRNGVQRCQNCGHVSDATDADGVPRATPHLDSLARERWGNRGYDFDGIVSILVRQASTTWGDTATMSARLRYHAQAAHATRWALLAARDERALIVQAVAVADRVGWFAFTFRNSAGETFRGSVDAHALAQVRSGLPSTTSVTWQDRPEPRRMPIMMSPIERITMASRSKPVRKPKPAPEPEPLPNLRPRRRISLKD
jgi:Uncharacterized conserved protein